MKVFDYINIPLLGNMVVYGSATTTTAGPEPDSVKYFLRKDVRDPFRYARITKNTVKNLSGQHDTWTLEVGEERFRLSEPVWDPEQFYEGEGFCKGLWKVKAIEWLDPEPEY